MVKVGSWHVGPNDSKLKGVSDQEVLKLFRMQLVIEGNSKLTLVGLTLKGQKTWTRQGELKEMQGHLRGFIRSKYGREMLDARKLNISFSRPSIR